ncbi:hypothetical protein [Mycolicibacterium septicum]|uniref:hypothetical protein n=1 Tax=Mycolicibacterium septicum TaxID=98668 RepID=UPI001AFC7463|nr:hypothetical protein [Mycolicibacterium septicum]QRY51771.1 hypothetical protein JVX95_31095 [Mycolicibacterium septicum]
MAVTQRVRKGYAVSFFGYLVVAVVVTFVVWHKERFFMSEVQNAVDAVVAQLAKAKAEIVTAIEELRNREPDVDLSALTAAAQGLDDIVPDAPVEEPVEEPSE